MHGDAGFAALAGMGVHRYVQLAPASGETLRDAPLFFRRVAFFPDVPEHEAIVDIHLPLAACPAMA